LAIRYSNLCAGYIKTKFLILNSKFLRYNDISPLENHHCAVAFQILSNPSCNIFSNVSEENFKEIRNGMVKLILGTDMAKHKELIDELQKYVSNFDPKNTVHMEAVSYSNKNKDFNYFKYIN